MMLKDKRLLVSGVVNTESIAFAVARRAQQEGARVALSAFPRDRELTVAAAAELPQLPLVLDLDATNADDCAAVTERLQREFGGLDGALHSVAFAPSDALAGELAAARPEGVSLAFQTSAFSLSLMAQLCAELAPPAGGSVVALGFGADRAWPVYNWMGVCKAALDATARYMARDLGRRGVRVNVVAAGPLHTRAAGGIPGFDQLLDAWQHGSALEWDPNDPAPVADAVCFLMSDYARAISGEVLHVDGGFHAMAAPLRSAAAAS